MLDGVLGVLIVCFVGDEIVSKRFCLIIVSQGMSFEVIVRVSVKTPIEVLNRLLVQQY